MFNIGKIWYATNAVIIMKKCIYCEESKAITEFPKHSLYKDRLDTRCRSCIKEQSKIRKQLKKTAPPKPDRCECCGQKNKKLCLDHDHNTEKFRGWICDKCNTGLGKLGDDIPGIINALNYLLQHKNKLDKQN